MSDSWELKGMVMRLREVCWIVFGVCSDALGVLEGLWCVRRLEL
jgi:hypothetical protein